MHVIKSKLIDVKKKWIASDHQHHHWIVEIKTDLNEKYFEILIYFEKNGIWCYCTRRCLSIRRHWGVCEFLVGVYMFVCFVGLFERVCVCVFFHFLSMLCGIRKSKYCITAVSSLLIWSVGWFVGLLLLFIFHSCTFLSFSLSIFTMSIPRKRTFKITNERNRKNCNLRNSLILQRDVIN